MTFSGSIADVNAALDGLTFTPTASYNGPASLQIQTSDLGQTGTGGTLTDDDTIDIAVGAGNVAPTISLPGGAVDYTEGDGAMVIDGAATVTDPDGGTFDGGNLTIDITANGTAARSSRDQRSRIRGWQYHADRITSLSTTSALP